MTELARYGKEGTFVARVRACGWYLHMEWRRVGAFAQDEADGVVAVPGSVGHALAYAFSVGVAGDGPQQVMGSSERLHGAGRPAVDIAEHMQHAVHIDTGHAPVQGGKSFRDDAPVGRVQGGTQERHPWPVRCDVELKNASNRNRFEPLDPSFSRPLHGHGAGNATVGGTSQPGGGPVRNQGRALIRFATSSHLRAISYGATTLGFHA